MLLQSRPNVPLHLQFHQTGGTLVDAIQQGRVQGRAKPRMASLSRLRASVALARLISASFFWSPGLRLCHDSLLVLKVVSPRLLKQRGFAMEEGERFLYPLVHGLGGLR